MIVWHSIDNLHCYHNETRPTNRAKILAKLKFNSSEDKLYYRIMLCHYDADEDIVFSTETDCAVDIPFEHVEKWIYLNELTDLM